MMEWFNKYAPCFMFKPHPLGNGKQTICGGLTYILWKARIAEGKDRPQHLSQKEYNELGTTVILMIRTCRPIFGSGEDVVLDSGFCVAKGITYIESKGVYAKALINKWHYWLKVVPGDLIDTHFEDKKVSDIRIIETLTEDDKLFKLFCIKEPDYVMKIMASWMILDEL